VREAPALKCFFVLLGDNTDRANSLNPRPEQPELACDPGITPAKSSSAKIRENFAESSNERESAQSLNARSPQLAQQGPKAPQSRSPPIPTLQKQAEKVPESQSSSRKPGSSGSELHTSFGKTEHELKPVNFDSPFLSPSENFLPSTRSRERTPSRTARNSRETRTPETERSFVGEHEFRTLTEAEIADELALENESNEATSNASATGGNLDAAANSRFIYDVYVDCVSSSVA